MQQTVKLRRTITRTLVLEVVQPLSKATLALIANGQASGIAAPPPAHDIAHAEGAWEVTSASPSCECLLEPLRGKKKNR